MIKRSFLKLRFTQRFTMASSNTVRWGILGCGKISNDFVNAMKNSETSVLAACAARSLESAETFAKTHGFARAYGSYEELCADAEVDVVYIGTIHSTHYPLMLLALEHNKHILVEKPFAINAKEAAHVIAVAAEKKRFMMEAVWTRFFPAVRYLRKLLADGVIGEVHHVNADIGFGFPASFMKRVDGNGATLGFGLYPLAFAVMVFGTKPIKTTAVGKLTEEGVDMYASVTLEYEGNTFATLQFTCGADLPDGVTISGSKGRIQIATNAHYPDQVAVCMKNAQGLFDAPKVSKFPLPTPHPNVTQFSYARSEGLLYEAEAVNQAVLHQQLEHPDYPLQETLEVMQIMDTIRAQLGVVYDQDL